MRFVRTTIANWRIATPKKRPPFPGVAITSGYRPHYLASMREIVKSDLQIFNPPKAISRQCPLPSRASSIDLEHPESFMKPDHATSDSASAGLACSLRGPVRSLCLFYTRPLWSSQVIPEVVISSSDGHA